MFGLNHADEQEPGFIDGSSWNFQEIGIVPKLLRPNKVDAVLLKVRLALVFIELEHGIEFIPL